MKKRILLVRCAKKRLDHALKSTSPVHNDECCNGFKCFASTADHNVCLNLGDCSNLNQQCNDEQPCCESMFCREGNCEALPTCLALGNKCGADSEFGDIISTCCDGLTCHLQEGTHLCAELPQCAAQYAECSDDFLCCDGLLCEERTDVITGASSTFCLAEGQTDRCDNGDYITVGCAADGTGCSETTHDCGADRCENGVYITVGCDDDTGCSTSTEHCTCGCSGNGCNTEPTCGADEELRIVYEGGIPVACQCDPICPDTCGECGCSPGTADCFVCPLDEFMVSDGATCSCSTDPCDACPNGSVCIPPGRGETATTCVDCECGFCKTNDEPCCEPNKEVDANNCKSTGQASSCTLKNFVGFTSSGNSCQGEEGNAASVDFGCGCVPANDDVCAIVPKGDDCFVCRKDDQDCNRRMLRH